MIKCYCGKEFQDKRILAVHISKKKDNLSKLEKEEIFVNLIYGKDKIEKAINRYLKEEVSMDCLKNEGLDLNKYITLLGIKRTSKQERATERYKNKIKNSIFEKYGVDNISKSEEHKKKKQFNHIKKRHLLKNIKKNGLKNINKHV